MTLPVSGKITNPFSATHDGVDIAVPVGTTVVAVADGTVTFEGLNGGAGNTIGITHTNGDYTDYKHLSKFLVPKGAIVTAGQSIALSGGAKGALGAGISTGPHLHFGKKVGGKYVDPTGGDVETAGVQLQTIGFNPLDPTGAVAGIAGIFQWWQNPQNLQRVALYALGATLLLIALIKILADTPVGQTVITTTKNAAKETAKGAVNVAEIAAVVPK